MLDEANQPTNQPRDLVTSRFGKTSSFYGNWISSIWITKDGNQIPLSRNWISSIWFTKGDNQFPFEEKRVPFSTFLKNSCFILKADRNAERYPSIVKFLSNELQLGTSPYVSSEPQLAAAKVQEQEGAALLPHSRLQSLLAEPQLCKCPILQRHHERSKRGKQLFSVIILYVSTFTGIRSR